MPNIPQPQRQDEPVVTDADVEALLAGTTDVPPGLRPVVDVLAALVAEPTGMELAGETRALAEFRRQAGVPAPARRARRSANGLSSRFRVKVGASVTAVAVVLGGGAAAAFADVLPAPIQRFAHDIIGAPNAPSAPQHHPARGKTVAPGQVASQPTASPKAHNTARPSNRQGQGKPGIAQGQPGDGQGQQGAGQGQPGNGQGSPPGMGQGNGQGQANPKASGQYGRAHPNPTAEPAADHVPPARHRPVMDQ